MSTATMTACPSWCESKAEDHPDGEGVTIHAHRIGVLGVAVEWCPRDMDSPVVYVPPLDHDMDMSASPTFARQLGADLIAAADLIEGGPVEVSPIIREVASVRAVGEQILRELVAALYGQQGTP